jgi:hypothetical protein
MASVHVILPDQSQAVYEDFEIPALLLEQHLTPETYYWQPGMAEWRRLAELIPLSPPPTEASAATPSSVPRPGRWWAVWSRLFSKRR